MVPNRKIHHKTDRKKDLVPISTYLRYSHFGSLGIDLAALPTVYFRSNHLIARPFSEIQVHFKDIGMGKNSPNLHSSVV